MSDKYFIKAAEARERMLNSSVLKNHVYKAILDTAKRGENRLYWSLYNVDPAVKTKIVEDLVEDGYLVEFGNTPDNNDAVISW